MEINLKTWMRAHLVLFFTALGLLIISGGKNSWFAFALGWSGAHVFIWLANVFFCLNKRN